MLHVVVERMCVHNAAYKEKIDEVKHGISHYLRLILTRNEINSRRGFLLSTSRCRVSTVWRRRERNPHFFTSLHLRWQRRRRRPIVVATDLRETRYAAALNLEWFMYAQNNRKQGFYAHLYAIQITLAFENEKARPWGGKGKFRPRFDRVSGNTGLLFTMHFKRHTSIN